MPQLDYSIVDVFTEQPFQGNPLAVVWNTCALNTPQMQEIAREFNLSETTFIERRPAAIERAQGVRVRIFTTREELSFAGHPTLGTASVLKQQAPETLNGETVTLALPVGAVPVRFASDGLRATMTQRDPDFGAVMDSARVARLAGLAADDLDPVYPPQAVSTGTAFVIVLLRSVEALGRLRVNQEEAVAYLRDYRARWFYYLAPAHSHDPADHDAANRSSSPRFRARMQFYGGEDPATGSAAGCAIAYLVQRGAVASGATIHVRQGVEIARPSDLFLSARRVDGRVTDIGVGGSTVPVANGHLFLP